MEPEAGANAEEQPEEPINLDGLRAAYDRLKEAEARWNRADDKAKAMKKAMTEAQAELNEVVEQTVHPGPLFEQTAATTPVPMETRLADLGKCDGEQAIAPRTLKALAENDPSIQTIAELAKWQETKGDFWASDIAGIGEAGRSQIEEAMESFWTAQAAESSPEPSELGVEDAA